MIIPKFLQTSSRAFLLNMLMMCIIQFARVSAAVEQRQRNVVEALRIQTSADTDASCSNTMDRLQAIQERLKQLGKSSMRIREELAKPERKARTPRPCKAPVDVEHNPKVASPKSPASPAATASDQDVGSMQYSSRPRVKTIKQTLEDMQSWTDPVNWETFCEGIDDLIASEKRYGRHDILDNSLKYNRTVRDCLACLYNVSFYKEVTGSPADMPTLVDWMLDAINNLTGNLTTSNRRALLLEFEDVYNGIK